MYSGTFHILPSLKKVGAYIQDVDWVTYFGAYIAWRGLIYGGFYSMSVLVLMNAMFILHIRQNSLFIVWIQKLLIFVFSMCFYVVIVIATVAIDYFH